MVLEDSVFRDVRRLFIGAVDQEIIAGRKFRYDGGELYADDVANLGLASTLCIAQDLSERMGMGGFGFKFSLGGGADGGFPLVMERAQAAAGQRPKLFCEVAPFVLEVFMVEVMESCHDLSALFECAANLVRPGFRLSRELKGPAVQALAPKSVAV